MVYSRDRLDQEKVYATYVVILPVSVDFSKYVPPFLVSHLGSTPLKEISAFSLPPVPEEVESYHYLLRLADMRDDDLIYTGTISSGDLPTMMQELGDVVQRYAELWSEYAKAATAGAIPETVESSFGVSEVMYSLLGERDRLNELSGLISRLRFAVEGRDGQMQKDAREEISILSRYLPEHYSVESLIKASMDASDKGTRLAKLYLDRCYKLSEGNEAEVGHLEQEIKALESSG